MMDFDDLEVFDGKRPRAEYYTELAPGLVGECQAAIRDHFERRQDGARYRLSGALFAMLALGGNRLKMPGGGKVMLTMITLAASGSGKQAPIDFLAALTDQCGLYDAVIDSGVSSLKQLQIAMIRAGGSLVYVVDDSPQVVKAWNDSRSAMGLIADTLRTMTTSSIPFRAPGPVIRELQEEYAKISNINVIAAALKREGASVPMIREGTGDKVKSFPDVNSAEFKRTRIGKQVTTAEMMLRIAQEGIPRASINAMISMTPEDGRDFMEKGIKNGQIGRSIFVLGHEERPAFLPADPDYRIPVELVEKAKRLITTYDISIQYENKAASDLARAMREKLDECRPDSSAVADVTARYGEMVNKVAALLAFGDHEDVSGRATPGDRVKIGKKHLYWAYFCMVDSLRAIDEFFTSDTTSDGTTITELDIVLTAVRKVFGRKAFDNDQGMSTSQVVSAFCRAKGIDQIVKLLAQTSDDRANFTKARNLLWSEIVETCEGKIFVAGEGRKEYHRLDIAATVTPSIGLVNMLERALNARSRIKFRK